MIPGLGRSPGEGNGNPLQYCWASLVAQISKESTCNAGDLSLIPGLGRSPGEGKGYPLQWVNSMDYTVHGVAKTQTRLSAFYWKVLAESTATHIPLTKDWFSSIGDGHPLRPSAQLQEGHTWSCAGGRRHLPSQPV